ncbi:MAG: DUF3881 family protein [Cellulosilyticaceae bacterium]
MESPLKAIGFSKLDEDYDVDDIISDILSNPTKQSAAKISDGQILAEYIREFAENTYVMVRVTVNKSEKKPQIKVQQCEPYVKAKSSVSVEELEIECIDDGMTYYVICEEKETSMQMIFWLQNVVDYVEGLKDDKTCQQVNVVALASEGTIILPVEKDEEDEQYQKEERDKIKEILKKMKDGDEEAKEKLEAEEKELDAQLKQRLKEEDFLTIMSGYFIPTTLEDATYAVLGDIIDIQSKKNKQTKEALYRFTLSVNDMPLEVMINAKDLVGMPSVGMRFMGTCWLQGQVIME